MENTALDIAGNELKVGDQVYYARKNPYAANGLLVLTRITSISEEGMDVTMGSYISTSPEEQLILKK